MSKVAPVFPLATGAVDPLKAAFEKAGKGDFSLLWAGEAGALAREEDAGALTRRLWDEALACAGRLGRGHGRLSLAGVWFSPLRPQSAAARSMGAKIPPRCTYPATGFFILAPRALLMKN